MRKVNNKTRIVESNKLDNKCVSLFDLEINENNLNINKKEEVSINDKNKTVSIGPYEMLKMENVNLKFTINFRTHVYFKLIFCMNWKSIL